MRKKQRKHQEQKFHKETCRKHIVNILPKVLNYDIAILSIHLKDDKFCEIDIRDICQIADDTVKKFRPLTTSSDDLNVHTTLRHDQHDLKDIYYRIIQTNTTGLYTYLYFGSLGRIQTCLLHPYDLLCLYLFLSHRNVACGSRCIC